MGNDNWLSEFSKWQRETSSSHPLLCQVGTKVVAAIIIAFFGWFFVQAKPNVEVQYPSKSEAKLIFSNEGLLSAYDVYEIASGPTVVWKTTKILEGEEYSKIEEISPNTFRVKVKGLPQNQKIIVEATTADTLELIGGLKVSKEK